MKQWMRYAIWFLLGGSLGYFTARTIDERIDRKRREREEAEKAAEADISDDEIEEGDVDDNLKDYGGELYSSDNNVVNTEDDPPMPTEKDIEIENDIPQLHPQSLVPEIISEQEYERNPWGYSYERMVYYGEDKILYNINEETIVKDPDEYIGVGTLYSFGGDPNNPIETVYVKNATFEVLFRIDFLDSAYYSEETAEDDGTCGPEDDAPEDDPEDFTKDDFWDDV